MLTPTGLSIGRLASQQSLAHLRTSLPLSIRRVAALCNLSTTTFRHYADRPVSRPKAHTGRTTSTRKPRAAAKPTDATAKASSSTAKPKTTAKPKAKSKAKPKVKAKAKRKTKPRAKPKRKTKIPPTDEQKTAAAAKKSRAEIRSLRAKLLIPPHRLPSTAYQILLTEQSRGKKGEPVSNVAKTVAAQYKSLSTEQREHYNHIANENQSKNTIQYRSWIESHTPTQVHESNRVRALLLKRTSAAGKRKVHLPSKLKDDREVKLARNGYNFFTVERFRSGDFTGIPFPEAGKRIGREWKELSAAERKPYTDLQATEMTRYEQEIKSVYNRDVKHKHDNKTRQPAS